MGFRPPPLVERTTMIKLSKSTITDADKAAVLDVLDREFLGMGPRVKAFEEALCEFFNRPVVAVCNGTAALQLSIQACGIGPGDEVVVPSLTYVASFQAISATGAVPVACDIDTATLQADPEDMAHRITGRTRAIMPVHYSGSTGPLDDYREIARDSGLRVIEDAAHALGTTTEDGQRIGSFGDIACFSFDGIKNITSGEGGCVVTDDEAVLNKIRDYRLLGVEKDSDKRYAGKRSWEFDVHEQGWRYHMSDIMAALGLSQLSRFEATAPVRRDNARLYNQLLADIPGLKTFHDDLDNTVPHIYPILLPAEADRSAVRKSLEEAGIQTGIHYYPNHLLAKFADRNARPLTNTESVFPRLMSLPLHLDLKRSDQEKVVAVLRSLLP
jgi:dTDP-4-amino-4,6-dideoxygalactose transaminase